MSLFLHAAIMAFIAAMLEIGFPMWTKWSLYLGGPLMAGFINGLIMGDVQYGLLMGGTIMMVYIGVSVIGGVVSSDPNLGGWIGVTVAMLARSDPDVGITVATTLGIFGSLTNPLLKSLNTIWVTRAHLVVDKGDTKPIYLLSSWLPVIWSMIFWFIPGFVIIYYGSGALETFLAVVPTQVTTALATIGHLLPSLGLAMLMNLLYDSKMIPYFVIGFFLTAYAGFSTTPVALVGVALAFMHYFNNNKEVA